MDEPRPEDQAGTRGFHIVTSSGSIKNYLPGDKVDNTYLLLKFLGRGGMGVVFSCRHLVLNREYALKIISGKNLNAETWTRFEQEARALARLNHPGIVGIHNMGVDAGVCPYFVMDLLKGRGLDQVLKRDGPLSPQIALPLFLELTSALSAAHRKGVVHRDIKPSNLMAIESDYGRVSQLKLTDFGLARLVDSTGRSQAMTATGLVFGTPFYMSPEQIEGKKLDQRADIYSLGCTIFETLTGRPPFVGDNAFQTFEMHQSAPVPDLCEFLGESITVDALQIFMEKILAKGQSERYQNMEEVAHDLERILAGQPVQNYRAGRTGGNRVSTSIEHPKNRSFSRQASTKDGVNSRAGEATRDSFEDELGSPFASANIVLRNAIIGLIAVIMILGGIGFVTVLRTEKKLPEEKKFAAFDSSYDDSVQSESSSLPDVNGKTIVNEPKSTKANHFIDNDLIKGFADGVIRKSNLVAVGATQDELNRLMNLNWEDLQEQYHDKYKERYEAFISNNSSPPISFVKDGDDLEMHFPKDIYLCAVSRGAEEPRMVADKLTVSKDSEISIFFGYQTQDYPELLRFLPILCQQGIRVRNIEFFFKDLNSTLKNLERIPNLKEVCFFNSLTKCIINLNKYEECTVKPEDLREIDKLGSLVSLGLPAVHLKAEHLASMKLIRRLHTLKLKRSTDIDKVLLLLKRYPNIKELWIIDCGLRDKDLEALSALKNLERLRIRRSFLTPASVDAFCRMSNLKTLYLDTKWINKGTSREFQRLKSKIPDCHYEPMVDFTYWEMFPGRSLFPAAAN